MLETINKAVDVIRARIKTPPQAGVVLGSGLGGLVDAIDVDTVIPYAEIPGAKAATVIGHAGQMVFGRAGKLPVVLLAGRMH